jgi:hypothetical protein
MGDLDQARVRERQLRDRPLCAYCLERCIVTRATICDYRDGGLVSLCANCAAVTAEMIVKYGYRLDIGLDGWPLDRNHPANRRR